MGNDLKEPIKSAAMAVSFDHRQIERTLNINGILYLKLLLMRNQEFCKFLRCTQQIRGAAVVWWITRWTTCPGIARSVSRFSALLDETLN